MLQFYAQARPESCVPACVRIVLSGASIILPEGEIYVGCETDIDGTLPGKTVAYIESLGLKATSPRLDSISTLETCINSDASHPIVFVNLSVLLGINVIHAVVVESIDIEDESISVLDPSFPPTGHRQWSLTLFNLAWQAARRQTILIELPKQ